MTFASVVDAQRDLKEIPIPDPASERAAMTVDPACEVNLFAATPELSKPIQINFDSAGGLWIASSHVYPQILPGEVANDKIIVLRDTDGDGVHDQRTVFADGLLIPTGVLPDGPHAAYVVDSTRLLYLVDTDLDGRADQQEIVLSGFGTEDTHHLVHTLRFGPDGCLYFNQSIYIHSHIDTPYGTRHLDGGGIWRYRPTTRRLEVFCKGFVNPWGHVFDSVGESFATDGAYGEGVNYVFPDSVFVASPGAQRKLKGMNPGSPKHCGLEILSGTHIPPDWSGDFVTNDFRGHRVCRFKTEPSGSSYAGRQQREIITSSHGAFRPIDAKMGPDGAIYLADWYNPIIQHGEVDFRDKRRDRVNGRIWRVSFPGRPFDRWPDFRQQSEQQLLELLSDPALPVRQFARQELWNRGATNPTDLLAKARIWQAEDPANRSHELLWLHEALGVSPFASNTTQLFQLERIDPAARRTVLRSLWRNRGLGTSDDQRRQIETLVLAQTDHPDPRLRLEAVVSAGQLSADAYPVAIDAVLRALEHDIDFELDFAVWQSLRKLDRSVAGTALAKIENWDGRTQSLAFAVTAIKTSDAAEIALRLLESRELEAAQADPLIEAVSIAGSADQLGRLLQRIMTTTDIKQAAGRLAPLFERTRRDRVIPTNVNRHMAKVSMDSEAVAANPELISLLADVTRYWKVKRFESRLIAALDSAEGSTKTAMIDAIGSIGTPGSQQALRRLLSDGDSSDQVAVARTFAQRDPTANLPLVIKLAADPATHAGAADILIGMLKQKKIPAMMAKQLGKQPLPEDLATSLLRRVQSAGGNDDVEQAIRQSSGLTDQGWKWTPELRDEILSLVASRGSAKRGEAIYRRERLQCIACHAIGDAGGLVGPNLISVGGSSPVDYLLESLLKPNAKLKEGYTTINLLTDTGEIYNGIVVRETEETLRLRLADGKEIDIAVESITQDKPGKSLMPAGLVDPLTKDELVDLVAFLSALGRDSSYTVSAEPVVRRYEALIASPAVINAVRRSSKDVVAKADPVLQWRSITARVDGSIATDEIDWFAPTQDEPHAFVRFRFSMKSKGSVQISLRSLQANLPTAKADLPMVTVWIDSVPTPIDQLSSLELSQGDHQVVLGIRQSGSQRPMIVRVAGQVELL